MSFDKSAPNRNHAYRNVAKVVGKVGKNGEVKVDTIDGLPFVLREGMEVHLTPPPLDGIRASRVAWVREMGDGWAVKFEDSNSPAAAFDLVGRLCLVSEEHLEDVEFPPDLQSMCGFIVVDRKYGELGMVVEVLDNPEQATLVVSTKEGAARTAEGPAAAVGGAPASEEGGALDGVGADAAAVGCGLPSEILIPLVGEFVCGVDDGTIVVDIPESLLRLNG